MSISSIDAMISRMARSRVYLPKLESPPATILEYLSSHFAHIPASTWRDRMARGMVSTSAGTKLTDDTPYAHGLMVFYTREVLSEPAAKEDEIVLFRDDEILAADKPHGMPVTPAGGHVARAMLNRLQERTGIDNLAPLHRLDRDTAGVVLFGLKKESRPRYHELFAKGAVEREYLAIAPVAESPRETHWLVRNRLVAGEPWFRRRVADEEAANAITMIDLIEIREGLGLFRLIPQTGKKHQLRVHMMSIGFPILGDAFYPEVRKSVPSTPLQLLASRLSFVDPFTGMRREFKSTRRLCHNWQPTL